MKQAKYISISGIPAISSKTDVLIINGKTEKFCYVVLIKTKFSHPQIILIRNEMVERFEHVNSEDRLTFKCFNKEHGWLEAYEIIEPVRPKGKIQIVKFSK